MKKILVAFMLISLLTLSSCKTYPKTDYESEYFKLEEEYSKLYNHTEKIESALSNVEIDIIVIYDYFYYGHSDFTESEAKEAAINIHKYLHPLFEH